MGPIALFSVVVLFEYGRERDRASSRTCSMKSAVFQLIYVLISIYLWLFRALWALNCFT